MVFLILKVMHNFCCAYTYFPVVVPLLSLSLTIINDFQTIHLELTSYDRRWSSFPLTIDCHDSHRVACVSVQSHHYHTALIGRHLTGRGQCTHSLPLSNLSPSPINSGGCDHHMVRDMSKGLHKGQRLPVDPYCCVIDTCGTHITWSRRCYGNWEENTVSRLQ